MAPLGRSLAAAYLDGMDDGLRDDGSVSDLATAREYADFEKKRAYAYSIASPPR